MGRRRYEEGRGEESRTKRGAKTGWRRTEGSRVVPGLKSEGQRRAGDTLAGRRRRGPGLDKDCWPGVTAAQVRSRARGVQGCGRGQGHGSGTAVTGAQIRGTGMEPGPGNRSRDLVTGWGSRGQERNRARGVAPGERMELGPVPRWPGPVQHAGRRTADRKPRSPPATCELSHSAAHLTAPTPPARGGQRLI